MNPAPSPSYDTAPAALLAETAPHAGFGDYLELTKPRLSLLSVLTAVVGYLAARAPWNPIPFAGVFVGTVLAAGGAAALNQWMEADTDARMRRTRDRPIPTGKVTTGSAFVVGWSLCLGGLAVLFATVNGPAALCGLATIVCYLAVYTPAKRWSRWSTELGAVAGALPPLIGWTGATGRFSGLGLVLFAVLFFWQLPHFLAIAWMYREDYAAVHFPMLAVRDRDGGRVAAWALASTALLVGVTLVPVVRGTATIPYGAAALALGAWFLARAVRFLRRDGREAAARSLFLASIAYLPLLLAALVIDRVVFF
ncbi:MAG TPA: heme o synthase [Opitutaceae bacterium]|nr:heme o synthase [Opitutaceae bacterium]